MTPEEVYDDTKVAIDSIEQCVGNKVRSYRAPAFSIGNDNKWVFEILTKCGITRDASVFPMERDFGGFAQFGENKPSIVYYNRAMFKEFPISTTRIWDHEVVYSGGGYFRFFPYSFVKKEMERVEYAMTYFHLSDIIPESTGVKSKEEFERYFKQPGTLKNRYMRYIKSNFGKKGAFEKLLKIIDSEDFVNLDQADKIIDWEQVPSIVL